MPPWLLVLALGVALLALAFGFRPVPQPSSPASLFTRSSNPASPPGLLFHTIDAVDFCTKLGQNSAPWDCMNLWCDVSYTASAWSLGSSDVTPYLELNPSARGNVIVILVADPAPLWPWVRTLFPSDGDSTDKSYSQRTLANQVKFPHFLPPDRIPERPETQGLSFEAASLVDACSLSDYNCQRLAAGAPVDFGQFSIELATNVCQDPSIYNCQQAAEAAGLTPDSPVLLLRGVPQPASSPAAPTPSAAAVAETCQIGYNYGQTLLSGRCFDPQDWRRWLAEVKQLRADFQEWTSINNASWTKNPLCEFFTWKNPASQPSAANQARQQWWNEVDVFIPFSDAPDHRYFQEAWKASLLGVAVQIINDESARRRHMNGKACAPSLRREDGSCEMSCDARYCSAEFPCRLNACMGLDACDVPYPSSLPGADPQILAETLDAVKSFIEAWPGKQLTLWRGALPAGFSLDAGYEEQAQRGGLRLEDFLQEI